MLELVGAVFLGLFLLLIPGFLFSLALFPKRVDLTPLVRAAWSLGLGVVVALYAGVALARPELRMLGLEPFLLAIAVFCAACAAVAYLRGAGEVLRKPKPPPPEAEGEKRGAVQV